MKAAVVEEPGVLRVREVPEPTVGPYDALCDHLYCATCTATDTHIKDGVFFGAIEYPAILGHEAIGRVRELGPKVRNFKVGDLVTRPGATAHPEQGLYVGWGGFAERGIVRDYQAMQEDQVENEGFNFFRLNQVVPPDIDPADATIIINWRETWSYITRMGVKYDTRVLVLGTGGVGLSFIDHAGNLMAREVVAVGSPARFELAKRLGATDCVDYHTENLSEELEKRHPEGFDFIIDAVGRQGNLDSVLPTLKPGGWMALYGVDEYGDVTVSPSKARGTFTISMEGYAEGEVTEPIVRMMREGRLRPREYYDRERIFPLEEINAAFAALKNREMVKAVVKCSEA
ncbi:MAG: zinc-binding dehydrogenase [candidate division WS1 bacterium]|nr:zinc-binding dehydrogenase [candidate division WS1 bacterium]